MHIANKKTRIMCQNIWFLIIFLHFIGMCYSMDSLFSKHYRNLLHGFKLWVFFSSDFLQAVMIGIHLPTYASFLSIQILE